MQADTQLAIFNPAPYNRVDVRCPSVVLASDMDLAEGDIIEVRHLYLVVGGGYKAKAKQLSDSEGNVLPGQVSFTGNRVAYIDTMALPGRGEVVQVTSTAAEREERYADDRQGA